MFQSEKLKNIEDIEKAYSKEPPKQDNIDSRIGLLESHMKELVKSLCTECGLNQLAAENSKCALLCSECNSIICLNCSVKSKCLKCGKRLCEEHSKKCIICDRRVCKTMQCAGELKECDKCESLFCLEHFEQHKKMNTAERFALKCTSEKCKITTGISQKGVQDYASLLIHITLLKELRLRN